MMPTLHYLHTKQCRRVSFDPLMPNSYNVNSVIQRSTDNNISMASASLPLQVPIASSTNLHNCKNCQIPNGSIPTLGRQLKRLRDSSTLKQAQTAILALVPTVHDWMQIELKQKASIPVEEPVNINSNEIVRNALDYSNNSSNRNDTTQHSSISNTFRAHITKTSSSTTNAGDILQKLHGIPIFVLTFKAWEDCPLVVSNILSILAFLVHHDGTIANLLVEMGGLRTIVRTISKQHHSKNQEIFTACVVLLSELAQHMPSTVASDACLALVVHSLWRFPRNGNLQGFGCRYIESVVLPRLLLWGVLPSSDTRIRGSPGKNGSRNGDDDETEDNWSISTIHQEDTLQKAVIPLLFRIKRNHHGSNPDLCRTADRLFHCINERLNNKVSFAA